MRSLTLVLALMLSGATCMVPPVTSALGRANVMSTRGHVYAMAKKPMVDEMPFANSLASLLSAAVVVASSITPLALPAPAEASKVVVDQRLQSTRQQKSSVSAAKAAAEKAKKKQRQESLKRAARQQTAPTQRRVSAPRQSKAAAPKVSKSRVAPVARKPKAAPVASKRKAAPVASKPKATPVASKPKTTPVASKPKVAPVASKPKAAPVARKSKAVPAARKPKAAPVVSEPQAAAVKRRAQDDVDASYSGGALLGVGSLIAAGAYLRDQDEEEAASNAGSSTGTNATRLARLRGIRPFKALRKRLSKSNTETSAVPETETVTETPEQTPIVVATKPDMLTPTTTPPRTPPDPIASASATDTDEDAQSRWKNALERSSEAFGEAVSGAGGIVIAGAGGTAAYYYGPTALAAVRNSPVVLAALLATAGASLKPLVAIVAAKITVLVTMTSTLAGDGFASAKLISTYVCDQLFHVITPPLSALARNNNMYDTFRSLAISSSAKVCALAATILVVVNSISSILLAPISPLFNTVLDRVVPLATTALSPLNPIIDAAPDSLRSLTTSLSASITSLAASVLATMSSMTAEGISTSRQLVAAAIAFATTYLDLLLFVAKDALISAGDGCQAASSFAAAKAKAVVMYSNVRVSSSVTTVVETIKKAKFW